MILKILQFIKSLFSRKKNPNIINVFLEDNKCGQKIKIVLRKGYDISPIYEDSSNAAYEVHKVAICDNCFNKIDLVLKFDRNFNIIDHEIKKGKMITKEKFYRK